MNKISQYLSGTNTLTSPVSKVLGDLDFLRLDSIDDNPLGSLDYDATHGIATSYKPFEFHNEVSYRPAIQQWMVCTP